MTTRHSGYLVTLSKDLREDDAQAIINALSMVKGVVSVQSVSVGPIEAELAKTRAKEQLREMMIDFFRSVDE